MTRLLIVLAMVPATCTVFFVSLILYFQFGQALFMALGLSETPAAGLSVILLTLTGGTMAFFIVVYFIQKDHTRCSNSSSTTRS